MSLFTYLKGLDKKKVISWALFDFANSSYALLIMGFIFPIYFKEVIVGNTMGDFYWGLVVSISILLGGLSAPIIGAIADYDNRRKTKFILFTIVGILGTGALYFTGSGTLLLAALLFIITNFCVEISTSLYDSMLHTISSEKNRGFVSGLGWGLGYLGGVIALLLLKPFYAGGLDTNLELYTLTFVFTAVFFLVFALPSFIFIKDVKPKRNKTSLWKNIGIGFKNTLQTIKEIKKHKTIAWFLLGFYFMNDALVTIFSFTPIYIRSTLSMSMNEILVALIVGQLIGFIATIIFGWLSDRYGSRKILLLTLLLWMIVILLLSIVTTKAMFYVIVVITGCIMGSSQAVARTWLSKMIPKKKQSQFFGFNGFASKIAATTGPVLFGSISVLTGNPRWAMLALLPFFAVAFIIFYNLKEDKKQ